MAAAPTPLTCWAEGCAAPSASACGRCRTAEYCGAPCQRAHWRAHKPRCKELEAAADAAEAAAETAAATAAALAVGGGGAGEDKPPSAAPRAPGIYSGLECRVQDYHCALVSCSAALEEAGANAICSGCRSVVYCNVECQTAHWEAHMEACYKAVRTRIFHCDVHQHDVGGEYVLRDRLRICKEEYGAVDERTLDCMSYLGRLMQLQGKLAEAGALFRDCLTARRAALGPHHVRTLEFMWSLAVLLHAQGNQVEAVPLMREALDAGRATLGPQHDSTLTYINSLADMLKVLAKLSEAEALYREALGERLATVGPKHNGTLNLIINLGGLMMQQGGGVLRQSQCCVVCLKGTAQHWALCTPTRSSV